MQRAVAVDLGATSGRFAIGTLSNGRIETKVVEQIAHEPKESQGILRWDMDSLLALCRRALDCAHENGATTLGIDSWGVDHGFLDAGGHLIASPVCYRDDSNTRAFVTLAPHRRRLYELTGIQHQPFNTISQLVARKKEDPSLTEKQWMILPDLLGYLLGGSRNHELTQASTTQLLGLDAQWSREAFEIIGWPCPEDQPHLPGQIGKELENGVRLAHVGSHDTASAVAGFGQLKDDQIFLNVGTWSLAGCVIDHPLTAREAETRGFTNELTVEGRVRFLKNIPGFYFINRLHQDLAISSSVPEWLATALEGNQKIDILRPEFYSPPSMLEASLAQCTQPPQSEAEWAGLALNSLASAVQSTVAELTDLTGRAFRSIRVGGGGSQSASFCRTLTRATGLQVLAGPAEATLLGNLAAQFLGQGAFANWSEAYRAVQFSAQITAYDSK